jgi:putative transcriptional regulator
MASLRGYFLLASPSLQDANFIRSVVLMVRHSHEGAMGLKINDPLSVTVAEAASDQLEHADEVHETLFRGGPVPGPVMLLHGLAGGEEVMPGVHFTARRDEIVDVMLSKVQPTRYVVNYSAWAADQLEQELAEGAWIVVPATPQDVFCDVEGLWSRLMTRANLLKFIKPGDIPHDPHLN